MITLRHDGPYDTAFALHFLLPVMLKSDLMRAAEKLSIYIPQSYTKDSSHYMPACLEARYGNLGEEAPSLALLNDTIQLFWKNKV